MLRNQANLIAISAILSMTLGCRDSSLEIAREAARRQAEQNHDMARVTSEAAASSRSLIDEQGRARRDMSAAQRDLHHERLQLGDSWNDLEAQRQAIASSRRTESFLASIVHGGGAAFAALLALGIAWLTLFGLSRRDDPAAATCELLIEDLSSAEPRLFWQRPGDGPDRLLPPPELPRLPDKSVDQL
jgi:hypothetical protein